MQLSLYLLNKFCTFIIKMIIFLKYTHTNYVSDNVSKVNKINPYISSTCYIENPRSLTLEPGRGKKTRPGRSLIKTSGFGFGSLGQDAEPATVFLPDNYNLEGHRLYMPDKNYGTGNDQNIDANIVDEYLGLPYAQHPFVI